MACGILVPQPGSEPGSPALGTWSLHNKASREFFDFLVHNRLHYTVVSLFFFLNYIVLAVLGLHCCVDLSLVLANGH